MEWPYRLNIRSESPFRNPDRIFRHRHQEPHELQEQPNTLRLSSILGQRQELDLPVHAQRREVVVVFETRLGRSARCVLIAERRLHIVRN